MSAYALKVAYVIPQDSKYLHAKFHGLALKLVTDRVTFQFIVLVL